MAWLIKLCTFAVMLVLTVDGQMNIPSPPVYPAQPPIIPPPHPPVYPTRSPAIPPSHPPVYPAQPPVIPPPQPPVYLPQPSAIPPQRPIYPPQPPINPPQPSPPNPLTVSFTPQIPPMNMPHIGYPINPFSGGSPAPYQQSYLTYTKQAMDCTDQSCQPNECCEFNGKRKVCVLQNVSANLGFCVRPKRCDDNGDCPSGHCCVIRLDVPLSPPPPTSYGAYLKRDKEERGECIIAALKGEDCRKPIDGVQTSMCSCSTGMCTFTNQNPLIGVCT